MRFDPDCARDILIAAEERTDGEDMEWLIAGPEEKTVDGLAAYSRGVSVYHVKLCAKRGLIVIGSGFIDGSFTVKDLTPDGHQALADLRKPRAVQMWSSAVSSGTLSTLAELLSWLQGIV